MLFDRIADDFDAVLTLSAPGEAPRARTQGDNALNRDWTLLHVPCVAIPVGRGPKNLPVGVQIIGPRMSDLRLLEFAKMLAPVIDTDPKAPLRQLFG